MNPLVLILLLAGVFFVVFVSVSSFLYMKRSKTDANAKPAGIFSQSSVGIIELNGVIVDSKKFIKNLEQFEEDESIKAVVVRLNSPGGSVAPSQEIYEAVKKFKKPIISSMASVAASGAFYVAMGTKKIYANPGTITGSIGVIMEFANLEKLYEWAKIKRFSIKTGKFKDAGAEYREMQPEERAHLQGMVDNVLGQFKKAVSEGRKMPIDKVTELADGRIFSGEQAKAFGLVDELGTLKDAINDVSKMAQLKGKPKIVYPHKPRQKLLDFILEEQKGSDEDSDAESRSQNGFFSGVLDGFLPKSLNSLENKITGLAPGIYWLWQGVH